MNPPSAAARAENALAAPIVRTDPAASDRETWLGRPVPEGYAAVIDRMRDLLDRVAGAAPDEAGVRELGDGVDRLHALLAQCQVDEPDQLSGRLTTTPGRAQLAVPVLHVDELDDEHLSGRTRFGRHFLGSNSAVHGGAIPLLFDDLLGRFALAGDRSRSRTAYLHVDYRSVTPIDTDLQVEAWFDREEGRKRFLRGTISDGDRLCAEATALFVALRPGQP